MAVQLGEEFNRDFPPSGNGRRSGTTSSGNIMAVLAAQAAVAAVIE